MGAKRSEVGLLKTKKTSVRTSEFMNDYRNEQTNECSKERTSDWASKRFNERARERTNERAIERAIQRTSRQNERANERTNDRASERTNKPTNKRAKGRSSDWANERTKEWMSGMREKKGNFLFIKRDLIDYSTNYFFKSSQSICPYNHLLFTRKQRTCHLQESTGGGLLPWTAIINGGSTCVLI